MVRWRGWAWIGGRVGFEDYDCGRPTLTPKPASCAAPGVRRSVGKFFSGLTKARTGRRLQLRRASHALRQAAARRRPLERSAPHCEGAARHGPGKGLPGLSHRKEAGLRPAALRAAPQRRGCAPTTPGLRPPRRPGRPHPGPPAGCSGGGRGGMAGTDLSPWRRARDAL